MPREFGFQPVFGLASTNQDLGLGSLLGSPCGDARRIAELEAGNLSE